MPSLTLPCWGTSLPVGPEVCRRPGFGRLQGGIKGQQDCGPLLHETAPGVAGAVHAASGALGLSAPACAGEVVLRPVPVLPAITPSRRTTGQAVARRLLAGSATRGPLRLPDLPRRLTRRTRTPVRFAR